MQRHCRGYKLKKLFAIIVLGLSFSTNAFADQSLINIIDIYSKRSNELKMSKVDQDSHLFLQEELKIATDKLGKVSRSCYREVLKNKKNYNLNNNCLKFRVILGNDVKEWTANLEKLMSIFEVHAYLAKDEKWLAKWDSKKFDRFVKLGNEMVVNVSIASELLALATNK